MLHYRKKYNGLALHLNYHLAIYLINGSTRGMQLILQLILQFYLNLGCLAQSGPALANGQRTGPPIGVQRRQGPSPAK